MLLQREDHAAALAALRAHLLECPGDAEPAGVPDAGELLSALAALGWITTVDEHGDLVGLQYGTDKAPHGATEGWPYHLLARLAPHLRHGRFERWAEPDTEEWQLVVGRREPVLITGRPRPSLRVIDRYANLDDEERIALGVPLGEDIAAADLPRAQEALRRYAARHRRRPGAGFLNEVLAAPDLRGALAAAGIGYEPTVTGGLAGFRLLGDELPGDERYLWGLFASLEGIVTGEPGFRFALAGDPGQWIEYQYWWHLDSHEWGSPTRTLVPRT
jgi:hypothetical protein